jgi:hypothetical protein
MPVEPHPLKGRTDTLLRTANQMERPPMVINIEKAGSPRKRAPWNLAPDGKRALRETLFAAPLLLAFLTGTCFTFGWAYLYEFYRFFGVDLYSLDLPVYDFLIASLWEMPRAFSILQATFTLMAVCGFYAIIASVLFRGFAVRSVLAKLSILLAKLFRKIKILRSESEPQPEDAQPPRLALSLLNWAMIGLVLLFTVSFVFFLGGDIESRARKDAKASFENPDLKTVLTFRSE